MPTLLDRFRRPEYTGADRCWPCTIANTVVLAILVGLLTIVGRRRFAAAVGAVGTLSIALRGYVVPYTPRFAPRLVAALPIDAFDHEAGAPDASGSLSDAGTPSDSTDESASPSGEDVVTRLLEAAVVVPDGEELRLNPSFRDDWRAEMRALRSRDLEELATVADRLTEPSVDVRTADGWGRGRSVLVLDGDGPGLVTLRRGVAVAELAAARALEPAVEDAAIRRAAGRPLRTLLERCPLCDDELVTTRAACCGETTPIGSTPPEKLACPACDERYFTFDGGPNG